MKGATTRVLEGLVQIGASIRREIVLEGYMTLREAILVKLRR